MKRDRCRGEYFWFKIGHFLFKISRAENLLSRSVKRCSLLRLEMSQRVQTTAEDFHVLFVAVYRNRNSKKNPLKTSGIRIVIRIKQLLKSNRLFLRARLTPLKN